MGEFRMQPRRALPGSVLGAGVVVDYRGVWHDSGACFVSLSEISAARHGRRFAVRWSNGGGDRDCTVPIRAVDEAVNAIVCPEQTGRTAACATCALCLSTDRNIAFIEH